MSNTKNNNEVGKIYVQKGVSKAGKPYVMIVTFITNPFGGEPIKIMLSVKSNLEQQALVNCCSVLNVDEPVDDEELKNG